MQNKQFPDGTAIDDWFYDLKVPALEELGKQYSLAAAGIPADGSVQTEAIQALIDQAHNEGGGVIVVPAGTYTTGALYFKQGVSLYLEKEAVLKGSDNIMDYPLEQTRIEGQSCLYFPALINVHDVTGFRLLGQGTIDGNGLRFWNDFWCRRAWNPKCTNKDTQRPRLVFIAGCSDVLVAGVTLQNSAFWTNHIYKSDHVKYLGCRILSPHEPVGAPSTDAIDIDACTDVLVKNCYMAVNDDAIALKGGKGPWADEAPENGGNERIIVEDCDYGFCHGCLTFGSESIYDRNIILRNITVSTGYNLLWMKLRPDTPQHYEYVLVENIKGKTANFLNINPWSQFFDLQGRTDLPISLADHVTLRNCDCTCDVFFAVKGDESQYHLADFTLENLTIEAHDGQVDEGVIENLTMKNVTVTRKETVDYTDSVTTLDADNNVK